MTPDIDCLVIGAGVVGLAVARRLALAGREVVVLEAQGAIGTGISALNSEVIHAGIYYPPGSLKARLCVAGRQALYAYCADHGVPHRRCGKLIVATSEGQLAALDDLATKARANGVDDLEALSGARARAREPALRAHAALLSPSTGIVDSHALMLAYQGDAEAHGAMVALGSPVLDGQVLDGGFRLNVGGDSPATVTCRTLVNSAGLGAQAVAGALAGLDPARVPPRHLAKGHYFALTGRAPFRHLIYPVPEAAGLGVHLTLDLAGQARFGPDVKWVTAEDYAPDPDRAEGFYTAIRTYWPALPDGALHPDYTGIRPKIQAPGEPAADFLIQGPADHGVPGLVNLFGIESPGLTASLAIAQEVAAAL
ncbi:MAG: NAD(P)/FAD-dependent oxidoreductase [Rhodobacterales bacterium]|nr:NAD(P)/FAD-dependent oxidoreductase [Rhodobacterales bacterium]